MGILSRLAGMIRRSKDEEKSEAPEGGSAPRLGKDIWDLPLTTDMSVSTVYRCVQLISDAVACLPLQYKRRKGGAYITDDNSTLSYMLGQEPDETLSAFDFKRRLVMELLLHGNAYVLPVYSMVTGGLIRLALCSSNAVGHDSTGVYSVSDEANGIWGRYTEREIIHVKGMPDLADPRRGVSVISRARQTIDIAKAGDSETLNRFLNGGDVRGFIANADSVRGFGEYQDRELRKKARELDRRFRELGDRIVELGGDARWIPVSMSSADMQFLESRKFTVREICRFFGVHPSFVFDDTSNNYKSAEMANVAFLSNTLNPLLRNIEDEFARKLFPATLAGKRKIEFDRRELYACDLQSKVGYLAKMIEAGLMTVNEARAKEGLPPVADGDTPLVSANLKTIGQLIAAPASPAPDDDSKNQNDDNDEDDTDR